MKFFKFIFLIVMVTLSSQSIAIEILSKSDAARTFNKTLSEWKNDSALLVRSGKGQVIQENEISVTMIVNFDNSILKITPVYKENNLIKPWKLAVAVEKSIEQTQNTRRLGDDGMRKLASKWHAEMLPEYTVMTEFDLKGSTLQINFSIFEFGSNTIIDSVGKETNGCWQGCIKK